MESENPQESTSWVLIEGINPGSRIGRECGEPTELDLLSPACRCTTVLDISHPSRRQRAITSIESAASAAIYFLDKEMSIQLEDINYNINSSAEVYIAKAEQLIL
jgi:hypothetical protein